MSSRYSAVNTLLNNCLLRMKITQPARTIIEIKRAIFLALTGSRAINCLRLLRERPFLSASSIMPIPACAWWESMPSSSEIVLSADKSAAAASSSFLIPFSISAAINSDFLRDCFYGCRLLIGGKPNLRSLLSRAFLSVELTLFAF